MRFCYFVLAAAATLVACTNAVSAETQLSQTIPELVARTLANAPINDAVKRSLRRHETPVEEERGGGGYSANALVKLATSKNKKLPGIIAKLSKSDQKTVIRTWWKQSENLESVAKMLGMKSITDVTHRNYPVLQRFEKLAKKHTSIA